MNTAQALQLAVASIERYLDASKLHWTEMRTSSFAHLEAATRRLNRLQAMPDTIERAGSIERLTKDCTQYAFEVHVADRKLARLAKGCGVSIRYTLDDC